MNSWMMIPSPRLPTSSKSYTDIVLEKRSTRKLICKQSSKQPFKFQLHETDEILE